MKTKLCLAKMPGRAIQHASVVAVGQQSLEEGGKCPLADEEAT